MSNHVVDLYSGCGGFSLGAHLAGFETAMAVDIDCNLSSSFERNFPTSKHKNWDLSQVSKNAFNEVLDHRRPTGIIGGPPCQGFSLIGKRDKNDPRNELVGHFFRHIRSLMPKFFVMENVPGILLGNARQILDSGLDTIGNLYTVVGPLQIDAANFGAATRRSRVVVIGYLASEVDAMNEHEILTSSPMPSATVKDAISDLAAPRALKLDEFGFDWIKYPVRTSQELSKYACRARQIPPEGLGWEVALRNLEERRVSGFAPTNHSDKVIERFKATARGATEKISRYPKLDWNSHCATLRAGTGPEKGSFQSVRPIHPDKPRVISVREAARLQGFPDWFVFHPTKWHSFRMIGNSVSPFVSQHLMSVIAGKIGITPKVEMAA